jgi:hypothetical protein
MRRFQWQILLGLSLLFASLVLYLVHYALFRDAHHIFIYLIGDLAFLPIEVLLVTIVIHELLEGRDRRARMEKLNMVIGSFFSEVGTGLLTYLSDFDPNLESIRKDLIVTGDWPEQEFSGLHNRLRGYEYGVRIHDIPLEELRTYLVSRRGFLLALLENQNLLEHESFTDLLWATFHLTDELSHRQNLSQLPETDLAHLASDAQRVYTFLVHQWLDYMKHLKEMYPYLFSLAMRTNPFDQNASVIVT